MEARRIIECDGLRAIAVVLVFLYHFDETTFYFGWAGVDVFFAISGFVITLQCTTFKSQMSTSEALMEFFARRTTRIFPLYYGLLLALFVSVQVLKALNLDEFAASYPEMEIIHSIWKNAFYLTNIYIFLDGYESVVYGITWSLAVEEHFYLIYPFAFFYFSLVRAPQITAIAIIVVILGRIGFGLFIESPDRLYYLTFSRFDALLFGCLAAQLFAQGYRFRYLGLLTATALSCAVAMLLIWEHDDLPMILFGYSIIPASIALLIYYIASADRQWLKTLLGNQSMVLMGSVSYGIYLLHIWIVNGLEALNILAIAQHHLGTFAGYVLLLIAEFLTIVLVAWLSFHLYEVPARKYLMKKYRNIKN